MASFGDLNRVNTNVQSLDAQLSLNRVNRDLANSQERLTTGKKINKAEDNAAGYSIATKLKSRIAGLEQSLQNVGDAPRACMSPSLWHGLFLYRHDATQTKFTTSCWSRVDNRS